MVQILPPVERKPSFGQRLSQGVGRGLEFGSQMVQENQLKQQQQQQNELLKNLTGMDFTGASEQMRQKALELSLSGMNAQQLESLKQQGKFSKSMQDMQFEDQGYDTMKKTFGNRFADLWKASPTGGRTKLEEMAINSTLMGEDVNALLESAGIPEVKSEDFGRIPEQVKQVKDNSIPKDFEWPNFSKRPFGYTPKTWADEKGTWRKENAPIFSENVTRLDRIDRDILTGSRINKLNETKKLPEGIERLLINPETGEFYGLAKIAGKEKPEVQEFRKLISQFQNRAKDAFGSRVTNFDLQSYMQQFPGLLNTYEGRKRILRMMDINWNLDKLYANSLDKIYKNYGLNGIPQEKADELSRKMISQDSQKLKEEFLTLDQENQNLSSDKGNKLSGKMIDVRGPDGQIYEIDESEIDQLPEGYRIQ